MTKKNLKIKQLHDHDAEAREEWYEDEEIGRRVVEEFERFTDEEVERRINEKIEWHIDGVREEWEDRRNGTVTCKTLLNFIWCFGVSAVSVILGLLLMILFY